MKMTTPNSILSPALSLFLPSGTNSTRLEKEPLENGEMNRSKKGFLGYIEIDVLSQNDREYFKGNDYHGFLSISVPPVCTHPRGKVYGVAKMETAHIACRVEANPPEVNFR